MSTQSVAVVGLGAMGSALARAFVAAGRPTTVWNRTAARAEPLAAIGASVAGTVEEAAATDVTVVCLLDSAAVEEVLPRLAGSGTVVVNLTSATPEQSRDLARRAAAFGLAYLDGAIMVPVPLIGTPQAHVLYSGDRELFERHRGTLLDLGGEAEHLGADPGLAALYDLGMLDVFFAGMTSFLHASAMLGADGVTARTFLPYAERVLDVLRGSIAGLAGQVDADSHPGDEDNLTMDLAALAHVVATSESRGVDPVVPRLSHDLTRAAVEAGHGRDGYSRIVTVLRGA
jgi:3-hydroxyisobutyrate dehydrogenase-like beta-hydroxyacid dehydrogenase